MESIGRVRSFALVGVLVGVAACADNTTTGPSGKTPSLRSGVSTARRGPTRFANTIKYRDLGKKNARGFAGLASLEARALLGIDGGTTLDVSTGSIDNPDASSLLSKLQLKLFAPDGTQQTTTNYKDINSPTYQLSLAGRVRSSKLQVLGNIVGVDGKHSDVVLLTETVKLRPDVSVDRIIAPVQASTGTPTEISAVIAENNGDVGARADCVLAVDGVDVGRANAIWVDAGRTVSCVFNHTFTTKGTSQLTVRAIAVNPGDWSAANNSATQSITIVVPNNFAWFGSYIASRDWVGTKLQEGYYSITGVGDRYDFRQTQDIRRMDTWASNVEGHIPAMTGPLTFTLHDEIGGQTLTDFAFDPATATTFPFAGTYEDPAIGTVTFSGSCTDSYRLEPIVFEGVPQDASPAHMRICTTLRSGPSGPLPDISLTDFQYGTSAGDVSYYAEDYQKYDDGIPNGGFDYEFSFNGDVIYTYGNLIFGNDYSFVVRISGPIQTRTASGTIYTTTYVNQVSFPYECGDVNDPPFVGRFCFAADYTQTNTFGTATGTPDP